MSAPPGWQDSALCWTVLVTPAIGLLSFAPRKLWGAVAVQCIPLNSAFARMS